MSKAFDEYMGGATNTERDDAEQAAQAQDDFHIGGYARFAKNMPAGISTGMRFKIQDMQRQGGIAFAKLVGNGLNWFYPIDDLVALDSKEDTSVCDSYDIPQSYEGMMTVIKGIKAEAKRLVDNMHEFIKNPEAKARRGSSKEDINTVVAIYSKQVKAYEKIVSGLSAF